MEARFFQEGKSLDYTPSSPVSAGDVIALQNNHFGVAKLDIAQDTPGALAVDGVFVVAKPAEAIAFGALLFWDDSGKKAQTTPIANAYIGRAACAAASTDDTVLLALNASNIGTVTVPAAQTEPSPTQEAIGELTAKDPAAITAAIADSDNTKLIADVTVIRDEVVNLVADLATLKASVNAGKADLAAVVALLVAAGLLE